MMDYRNNYNNENETNNENINGSRAEQLKRKETFFQK